MKTQTAVEVKERPMLFSGEMIRKILSGEKTQTRRVVKPQPTDIFDWCYGENDLSPIAIDKGDGYRHPIYCPYGKIGERLWCRETWLTGMGDMHYRADGEVDSEYLDMVGGWRPSIFMPRWASRITLEIVDIRVERLADISEADALAEGGWKYSKCPFHKNPEKSFADLWDKINGKKYPFSSSPFVWVIEFKKI